MQVIIELVLCVREREEGGVLCECDFGRVLPRVEFRARLPRVLDWEGEGSVRHFRHAYNEK